MEKIINLSNRLHYVILACLWVFYGCTQESAPITVQSVTLDPSSMVLIEGATQKLSAIVSPSNAENKAVIWTSSNSSVASVKDGFVTAIKYGKATITVETDDGGKTATCEVTVNAKGYPVEGISLDKTSYVIPEGDEFILIATVYPDDATNKNVTWSSSNTSVANVKGGKVTALKAGNATITVTTEDGQKTATCEVTVNAKEYPVGRVSLDKTSYVMPEGEEFTLIATVYPNNATNKNLIWSSNNTSVATVTDGKVTALKAGNATITVTTEDGQKTATCDVIVKEIIDVSASGTANCYIVSESGYYKFTPSKGNSNESVGTITSVEVLWETFGTDIAPKVGELITNVNFADGIISFQTPSTYAKGNALIAAKDASGNILWSWHIWLTDLPEEQVYYNNAGIMLDRNLGATSSTIGDVGALGLLYQWGRKDPFLAWSSINSKEIAKSTTQWPSEVKSDASTGTISFTIANPTTFITGNDNNDDWYYLNKTSMDNTRWDDAIKTIYDPCPTGWRIPQSGHSSVWATASNQKGIFKSEIPFDKVNGGFNFQGIMGDDIIWYPAAAYRPLHQLLNFVGRYGYYWTSTNNMSYVYTLHITEDSYIINGNVSERAAAACSVRCIKE